MAERVYPKTYSVEQILFYLRQYLGEEEFLSSLAVRGEVSGFKAHGSGHVYFSLREGNSQLRVVMFRRYASVQQWFPRDGEQAVVIGSLSLYERDGSLQLYAQAILAAGEQSGGKQQERTLLQRRLEEEGLFAPERKRPLPAFAASVGVVTAENSAAWADMDRILHARLPGAEVKLYPALVQGDQAPESLAAAIARADRGGHDVLLVGRGGGADEDLAAFDTEIVVRAIAETTTPVIAAVGHESDVSLADLAADVRAATPTHGATLAVPDGAELRLRLDQTEMRLERAARALLSQARARWQRLAAAPCLQRPEVALEQRRSTLDRLEQALEYAARQGLGEARQRLTVQAAALEALSPLATLARGYSLVWDNQGRLVRSGEDCRPGDELQVRLAKGTLDVTVVSTR